MRFPIDPPGAGMFCLQGKGLLWLFLTLVLVGFVAGCSSSSSDPTKTRLQTSSYSTKPWPQDSLASPVGQPVLLMPLDIELAELTASGLLEPNAAWTATAKVHADRTVDGVLSMHGAEPVRYRPPARPSLSLMRICRS